MSDWQSQCDTLAQLGQSFSIEAATGQERLAIVHLCHAHDYKILMQGNVCFFKSANKR